MKTYTFVLLTASALAATAMECVETGDWTAVTLTTTPAADSAADACKTACTEAVDAETDKADKDYCCESAVTAKVDAVAADPDASPPVEEVAAVDAAHACALYSAATGATSISTAKADADGVTNAAWDYTAGVVAADPEPESTETTNSTTNSTTAEEAEETTDNSTADADADSASKMVASVLASAAFVAAMY